MKRKSARARETDVRDTSGAIDFDAALEAYVEGGDPEELLQAAGKVINCNLALAPEHAAQVSALTAEPIEIESYSDAAHAIRRWLATMREPGPRH